MQKDLPLFVAAFALSIGKDEWTAASPESDGAAGDRIEGNGAVIASGSSSSRTRDRSGKLLVDQI